MEHDRTLVGASSSGIETFKLDSRKFEGFNKRIWNAWQRSLLMRRSQLK
jgi:hypothetical protein